MNLKYLTVSILCLTALIAQAQTPLSLEDAIGTSLANNYDIRLSRNDSTLAELDYAFSRYAFYPRIFGNAGVNYNNNNSKQTLADGSKKERNGIKSSNVNASLNLNWTLFDGLKMFITRRRMGELVELGELQIKSQVVTTVADVMRLYYDIVRQQQVLKALEEQLQLTDERLRLSKYRFEIGTGTKSEMLQAQVDYNAIRSLQLTQETNILKAKEQLNNLLTLPLDNDFTPADTSITVNTSLTLNSIRNGIDNTNPELLMAQKNLAISDLVLQERKAERFPTLSFNSAYNFTRTENKDVINPFQPLFNQNRGLAYGLTATIPIFNGMVTRRNIRAAQIDIEYQQLSYKRVLAQINTNVQAAYRDYSLYRQTLQLEEENIKLVRENLFIATERYRVGVTTFLEMRIAQQSLADAMTRLIEARYNTKVAEIELMRLRGDLVR
ncbi:MAG: TolC family protein [Flavisolibacter sp.]